jgi:hypothetical protein
VQIVLQFVSIEGKDIINTAYDLWSQSSKIIHYGWDWKMERKSRRKKERR